MPVRRPKPSTEARSGVSGDGGRERPSINGWCGSERAFRAWLRSRSACSRASTSADSAIPANSFDKRSTGWNCAMAGISEKAQQVTEIPASDVPFGQTGRGLDSSIAALA